MSTSQHNIKIADNETSDESSVSDEESFGSDAEETDMPVKTMLTVQNNVPEEKLFVSYPDGDGKFFGVLRLPSGYDEKRTGLRISECKTKVVQM